MRVHISYVLLLLLSSVSAYVTYACQPYITKAYFGLKNPGFKLAKIAIGDGSLNNDWVDEVLPTVRQGTPSLRWRYPLRRL